MTSLHQNIPPNLTAQPQQPQQPQIYRRATRQPPLPILPARTRIPYRIKHPSHRPQRTQPSRRPRVLQPRNQQADQSDRVGLEEVYVGALRAVEEVLFERLVCGLGGYGG